MGWQELLNAGKKNLGKKIVGAAGVANAVGVGNGKPSAVTAAPATNLKPLTSVRDKINSAN
ncbi:MAG: hypothetical protein PF589_12265, partial [Gammaproteobacteria bacterium]|nr:hypothetical protein [Gammaproteobacteria bacterium]